MAGFFGKFFGNTISEAAAYGIGSALEKPLEPALRELTNETWRAAVAAGVNVPLEAGDAADIVAEDVELEDWGADQAAQTGIGEAQFDALVRATLNAPGVAEALTLWRRGLIDEDGFAHALRKTKLETLWDAPLKGLFQNLLTPEQIALGMVRSVVDDQGLLVRKLDTTGSNIPQYEPYQGDGVAEAAMSGVDKERLRTLVGEIGLPLGAIAAAQAYFRGILTLGGYYQAIEEGDTRPEWADAILAYARQIPTAHDFIEMRLRNYYTTDQQLYDATARHGMSEADTDVLFQVTGRPLSWHQTWTGLRRGGTLGGPIDDIDPAFLDALRKSNIRPEYYNLAWADRNPLPAPFMIRQWLKDGGDTTVAHDWLWEQGWLEVDIDRIITEYAGKGSTTVNSHVKSAQTAVISAAKKAYLGGSLTPPDATVRLISSGLSATDAASIIAQWNVIAQIEGTNIDTAGSTPH